jgi:hypothetical protein
MNMFSLRARCARAKYRSAWGNVVLCAGLLAATSAGAQTSLAMNQQMDVNGVSAVCTGIGDFEETNARWGAFPLKVELVGKGGQYLANADVTLSKGASTVAFVHCDGPYVLFKPAAGRYTVTGVIQGVRVSSAARVPKTGQGRVILRFAGLGGAISPQHVPADR